MHLSEIQKRIFFETILIFSCIENSNTFMKELTKEYESGIIWIYKN